MIEVILLIGAIAIAWPLGLLLAWLTRLWDQWRGNPPKQPWQDPESPSEPFYAQTHTQPPAEAERPADER